MVRRGWSGPIQSGWRAAQVLGHIKDPAAVPALIKELPFSGDEARSDFITALGQIDDPAAVPALTEALKYSDKEVRSKAALALRAIRRRADTESA